MSMSQMAAQYRGLARAVALRTTAHYPRVRRKVCPIPSATGVVRGGQRNPRLVSERSDSRYATGAQSAKRGVLAVQTKNWGVHDRAGRS